MNKDEALRLALEAFTAHADLHTTMFLKMDAIAAIRQALEQPEPEPVAWGAFYFGGRLNGRLYSHADTKEQIDRYIADRHQSDDINTFRAAPLYTSPPKREPLTDEEIAEIASTPCAVVGSYVHTFARAIEAAHGIKGEA